MGGFTALFLSTEAQFQYCGSLGLIGLRIGNFFFNILAECCWGHFSAFCTFLFTYFLHHTATWCTLEILDALYLPFS